MRLRAGILSVACAASLLAAVPTGAANAASCAGGPSASAMATTFYTFTVEASPVKKLYKLGTKAKVHMTVTRPGKEDPLGEHQPMPDTGQSFPAENVEVSVSVYLGEYHYTYGIGVTDANGEEVVTVPLPKDAPSGPVRAAVAARAYYNRGGCPDFEEVGYNAYDPFFVAKR